MGSPSPIEPDQPDGGYGMQHRGGSPLHDWRVKVAIQTALSAVPGGHRLNYLLQRHVTRTLPVSDPELRNQVLKARRHLDAFLRHRSSAAGDLHLYEFGAGWDLVLPITYYALGVERQTIVDLRPLARGDLVADAAARIAVSTTALGLVRPPQPIDPRQLSESLARMGISYSAPVDARRTGIADGSFDLITSTDVLEHVPSEDISDLLRECRRLLRPGGLLRVRIDYQDHYWYFDARLTPYSFLRYRPRQWRRYNPGLHYQNRLRHNQLLSIVLAAGFAVLEDDHPEPTEEDLTLLASVRRADPFGAMSDRDCAIRFANLTLTPIA